MTVVLIRRTNHPMHRSITRRKQLAQEIRTELQGYRHNADDFSDEARDRRLSRTAAKFSELAALEGMQAVTRHG